MTGGDAGAVAVAVNVTGTPTAGVMLEAVKSTLAGFSTPVCA